MYVKVVMVEVIVDDAVAFLVLREGLQFLKILFPLRMDSFTCGLRERIGKNHMIIPLGKRHTVHE